MAESDVDKKALKILVVDDEEAIRDVLGKFFEMDGHEVRTADSGVTALPFIDNFEPHIVLLDVRMPDMDGIQCLRAIKKKKPGIEVIMVSGFVTEQLARKSLELGAFDYISKPLDFNHLKEIIQLIKITKFVGLM